MATSRRRRDRGRYSILLLVVVLMSVLPVSTHTSDVVNLQQHVACVKRSLRVMLTDITRWREAALAHAQGFARLGRPGPFIGVSRFVDPQGLVEFEVDAIAPD